MLASGATIPSIHLSSQALILLVVFAVGFFLGKKF